MTGAFGEKASLGQANGPDVDLVVRGTPLYATYHTPNGFPVVYDDALGLFCYARVADGAFESTGVAVTLPPPPGVAREASESDAVRKRKIEARTLELDRRAPARQRPTKQRKEN